MSVEQPARNIEATQEELTQEPGSHPETGQGVSAETEEQRLRMREEERSALRLEIFSHVDADKIRRETVQELEAGGLYETDATNLPRVWFKDAVTTIRVDRNIALQLLAYAEGLPEGPEKDYADELGHAFYSHSSFDEGNLIKNVDRKDLETLRRFGVIDDKTFEMENLEGLEREEEARKAAQSDIQI